MPKKYFFYSYSQNGLVDLAVGNAAALYDPGTERDHKPSCSRAVIKSQAGRHETELCSSSYFSCTPSPSPAPFPFASWHPATTRFAIEWAMSSLALTLPHASPFVPPYPTTLQTQALNRALVHVLYAYSDCRLPARRHRAVIYSLIWVPAAVILVRYGPVGFWRESVHPHSRSRCYILTFPGACRRRSSTVRPRRFLGANPCTRARACAVIYGSFRVPAAAVLARYGPVVFWRESVHPPACFTQRTSQPFLRGILLVGAAESEQASLCRYGTATISAINSSTRPRAVSVTRCALCFVLVIVPRCGLFLGRFFGCRSLRAPRHTWRLAKLGHYIHAVNPYFLLYTP
ncbi:hypothetical protein PENSPDRAFT_672067 [Peniophora sp. CONT]|nr:hypothetical protein PENSPDRAFT_672067 [Peniophora sp. CONT]